MKLAELCDVAPNYFGEIEIGRRFPSLKVIERIGQVLNVEPYRFFMSEKEPGENQEKLDAIINLLSELPLQQRVKIINQISTPLDQAST